MVYYGLLHYVTLLADVLLCHIVFQCTMLYYVIAYCIIPYSFRVCFIMFRHETLGSTISWPISVPFRFVFFGMSVYYVEFVVQAAL